MMKLTGSVINMDMMGHKNSSGAPESSSSSSLHQLLIKKKFSFEEAVIELKNDFADHL